MIIFLSLFYVAVVNSDVIETNLGRVEGTTLVARNGRLFKAYMGIPYAEPPTGNLRFQPPVPIRKWNGTFNASIAGSICPQIPSGTTEYSGDEDCLHVNVYTPQEKKGGSKDLLQSTTIVNIPKLPLLEINDPVQMNAKRGSNIPVIVYIFGGVFRYGSTYKYGPEYMLSRDIVLVMVSYRISVLGFLSTGDSVISGNMGLKDQSLAMKWTKQNIYAFGGDPDRITLQGHSSGAVCVHLHTLSPLSKGYFTRVIIQSGTGTAPHMFFDQDTARGQSTLLARRFNCTFKSTKELMRCLITKNAEDLVRMAEQLRIWQTIPFSVFKPTFEDKQARDAFLTEVPVNAPYSSTEPIWMIGMTSAEEAGDVSSLFTNAQEKQDLATCRPNLLLPILDHFLWMAKPAHSNYITQAAVTHFFGDEKISPATDRAFVELLTGVYCGMSMLEAVQKYKGHKYLYLYDYKANSTHQNAGYGRDLGVSHADEVPLLFKQNSTTLTDDDYAFGDEMITRWINFAYTGNPNEPFPINTTVMSSWSPMTSPRMEYLRIRKGGSMEANYFREKFGFWLKLPIYSKYR